MKIDIKKAHRIFKAKFVTQKGTIKKYYAEVINFLIGHERCKFMEWESTSYSKFTGRLLGEGQYSKAREFLDTCGVDYKKYNISPWNSIANEILELTPKGRRRAIALINKYKTEN